MSDKPKERELTAGERQEITDELVNAREIILQGATGDADSVVLAIRDLVDAVRDDQNAAPSTLDETGFLAGANRPDVRLPV